MYGLINFTNWNSQASYLAGQDFVVRFGIVYKCLADNENMDPAVNPAQWEVFESGSGSGGSGVNYIGNGSAESGTTGWVAFNDQVASTISTSFATNDQITRVAHGFVVSDAVVFISGSLGTGLVLNKRYFVSEVVSSSIFKVSETRGGASVDITVLQGANAVTMHKVNPVDGISGTTSADLTFTTSTTNPLRGTASFRVTKAAVAAQAGKGFSYDFSIQNADRAKTLRLKLSANLVTSTALARGDIEAWIYDVTNSRLIQPVGFEFDGMVSGIKNQYAYISTFQTSSDSTSYRLILLWTNANTTAYTVALDDIEVGPQPVSLGVPSTDWVPYTVQVKGSTSDPTKGPLDYDQGWWRRVGDSVQIAYQYKQSSGGTAGTGTYAYSMPPGIFIDTTKTAPDDGAESGSCGSGIQSNGTTTGMMNVGVDSFNLFGEGGGFSIIYGLTGGPNGSGSFDLGGSGMRIGILATFPVKGWGSNVVMSANNDSRVVAFKANVDPLQTIPNATTTKVTNWVTQFDSHGGLNVDQWVVPSSGKYNVHAQIRFDANATGYREVSLRVNGAAVAVGPNRGVALAAEQNYVSITSLLDLKAGDYIEVFVHQTSGAGLDIISEATGAVFEVFKISDGASLAASEKVIASVFHTVVQAVPNTTPTPLIFDTVVKDSHGSYDDVTGMFVCPRGGDYKVSGSASWQANATGTRIITVLKNGSVYAYGYVFTGFAASSNIYPFSITLTDLKAGDTISLNGTQDSGGSLNFGAGGPNQDMVTFESV